ncbi:unnamed protein product [Somion occarium]|uniref:MYND-type domain-containing protein n=1 Tax=Somion occarium TaxID=3059160 RepID=A0ABP1CPG8_9APHY
MLGLRRDIQQSAAFTPRAYLEGLKLPANFTLPPLSAVYEDAVRLPELRKSGPPTIRTVFVRNGAATTLNPTGALHEPLAWNTTLPDLFKFAYFARTEDVPVELMDPVIWALGMFIRALLEGTESQLRAMGHILPHQKAEDALYFMTANARFKLIEHLLSPFIDRPDDAIPHLKVALEQDNARRGEVNDKTDPYQSNPMLYVLYTDALVFSNQFDKHTRDELNKVLHAVQTTKLRKSADFSFIILKARSHLALVLQQMGSDEQEQKEHVEYCAKFLRKNPKLVPERSLLQLLFRRDQPIHPVLELLGGLSWLKGVITREGLTARMEERQTKACRYCGGREPQVTLFRCSGCKHIYYCSKECQKTNWKVHKEACKEAAAAKATDWIKFRESPIPANNTLLAHALGLYRDPSRGHTHIVFREVEYRPKASKDFRFRFHAKRAGVFKIEDVMMEIERMMGLNPGEGPKYVREILEDLDATNPRLEKAPILNISFGDGIQTWLGSAAISVYSLRMTPHNPRWRESMNLGEPPEPLLLKSGAQDVEHVF